MKKLFVVLLASAFLSAGCGPATTSAPKKTPPSTGKTEKAPEKDKSGTEAPAKEPESKATGKTPDK
jgi:hypothetical protein